MMRIFTKLFTKRKCKQCSKVALLKTDHFGYWVLACEETDRPIAVSTRYTSINDKAPKWCPKKWRNR